MQGIGSPEGGTGRMTPKWGANSPYTAHGRSGPQTESGTKFGLDGSAERAYTDEHAVTSGPTIRLLGCRRPSAGRGALWSEHVLALPPRFGRF